MSYDLLITNALIADETAVWRGALAVRGGVVAALLADGAAVSAALTIDAAGRALLPGLVDAHTHFNEPGRADWEGFATGSASAAAGGVTTVIDMPLNNFPAATDGPTLTAKRAALVGRSLVDYGLWGGLVPGNVHTLPDQDAAGALAYKAFMSNSGIADFGAVDDAALLAGLHHAARSGKLVAVHAESDAITARLAAELRARERTDRRAWLESRPIAAELEAITRALRLAEVAGARLHIVHVSSAAGAALVAAARRAGQPVSCETCPHYLALDEDDFLQIGPEAKCAPPLRPRAEVEALWAAVLRGDIDTIGSDHSPCPTADKRAGDQDIWQAWGGISGIQLMLPLLLDAGLRRGLTLPALVRLTSANPARLFGLPAKGALRPGADADLTLVNLDAEWTVGAAALFARHPHSPYIGRQLRGQVDVTIVRGQVVYQDGTLRAAPGYGRLVTAAG